MPGINNMLIKRWTWRFTLFLLLTTTIDLLSTYHGSPNLTGELNPLVISMGTTWKAVFIVKGTTLLVTPTIFFLSLRALNKRSKRLYGKDGFSEIMGHLIFKKKMTLYDMAVELPKDLGATTAFLGICLALSPTISALIASFANIFLIITTPTRFYLFFGFVVMLIAVLAHYLTYRFLSKTIES